MVRLLALCAFLLGVSYAAARNTSSVAPSTTATISPVEPVTSYNFLLKENGKVCAHLQADFTITVMYKNTTNTTLTTILTPYGAELYPKCNATENPLCSFCNVKSGNHNRTQLTIQWNATNSTVNLTTYYLAFLFDYNSEKGSVGWSQENITFNFNPFHNADFTNYTGNSTNVIVSGGHNLFETEESRSYQCNSKETVDFTDMGNTSSGSITKASMALRDFRVQAFVFHNYTTGDFGNAKRCPADESSGSSSKVVPIAVGAALAGLVVVVLIAYLIGRFKSRKQSSYEALS